MSYWKVDIANLKYGNTYINDVNNPPKYNGEVINKVIYDSTTVYFRRLHDSPQPSTSSIEGSNKGSIGAYNGVLYVFYGGVYAEGIVTYDSSLTRWSENLPTVSSTRDRFGADGTAFNNYAVFIGGGPEETNAVTMYGWKINQSGTREGSSNTMNYGVTIGRHAIASNDTLMCSLGGCNQNVTTSTPSSSSNYRNNRVYWNTSWTKTSKTDGPKAVDMSRGSIGNYCIYAGGKYITGALKTAYSVNTSGTLSTIASLSEARGNMATTLLKKNGSDNLLLFAGGDSGISMNSWSSTVDAYNTSLTKTTMSETNSLNSPENPGYQAIEGGSTASYGVFLNGDTFTCYNGSGTKVDNPEVTASFEADWRSLGKGAAYGNGMIIFNGTNKVAGYYKDIV